MKLILRILERIQQLLEIFFWSEHYSSSSSESKAQVATGPALLKSAFVSNNTAGKLYVHLFDADAEPATGATPMVTLPLPGGTSGTFEYNRNLKTGIYIALSSTQFTYTDAAADATFNVEFKPMVK